MVRAEIFRKYFCELNQCTQYELKYKKYDKTDDDMRSTANNIYFL